MSYWIQLPRSVRYDLEDPNCEVISIEALARALSQLVRFCGWARGPLSVAQHSLLVESLVSHPALKLPALLHDAHEVLSGTGDITRPAQQLLELFCPGFRDALKRLHGLHDQALADRFSFPVELFRHPAIKRADDDALLAEARDHLGPPPEPWEVEGDPPPGRQMIGVLYEIQRQFTFRLTTLAEQFQALDMTTIEDALAGCEAATER